MKSLLIGYTAIERRMHIARRLITAIMQIGATLYSILTSTTKMVIQERVAMTPSCLV